MLSLFALFCLPACQQSPVVSEPVEVKVPVAIPCRVDMPPEPVWLTLWVTPETALPDRVKAILADLERSKGHILELKAAIHGRNAPAV